MVRYTLYTEDKFGLTELVSKYFDGATLQYGLGLWKGDTECSCKIELIIEENLQNSIKIESLCYDIKAVNEQETVMIIKDNPLIWWL